MTAAINSKPKQSTKHGPLLDVGPDPKSPAPSAASYHAEIQRESHGGPQPARWNPMPTLSGYEIGLLPSIGPTSVDQASLCRKTFHAGVICLNLSNGIAVKILGIQSPARDYPELSTRNCCSFLLPKVRCHWTYGPIEDFASVLWFCLLTKELEPLQHWLLFWGYSAIWDSEYLRRLLAGFPLLFLDQGW
ncbi:uncharacterized protein BO97DRAFT_239228 [Aspergillus homomorphus CBS 101889]|uniref:Uncharacterized protein n=1 Tax=Aspergillus homomorphus (strain CBS 101889) TaxID=1450537 RepID=A0A395I522_ASPHC|nr:hypothetical protein BO97DRAFT_239228 [Aspergillus homomorphus CBS 101889]RAL15087.1 hypothetical protein BO97DRAFT_239228 [Aspergillus homomorphus CBS 101889]